MTERLYYLIREGSSIRAVTHDRDPVIATEATKDDLARHYEMITTPRLGRIVPILVEDYYERFRRPLRRIKSRIDREEERDARRGAA